jgi:signal transduction histidine kinase/ligand-binding sensor domain-containing protein
MSRWIRPSHQSWRGAFPVFEGRQRTRCPDLVYFGYENRAKRQPWGAAQAPWAGRGTSGIRVKRIMVLGRHSIRPLYGLISAVLGLCAGSSDPLLAQDQKIFQMIHTAWTARDGAPQNINAMTQAADGTLWFGTRDGLYSFDGLTFSAFQPVSGSLPRGNVQFVFGTKNGDLWVAGRTMRAVRIRHGTAELFDRLENAKFDSLRSFQDSSDRTVWAILNDSILVRFGPDEVWHGVPEAPKSHEINSIFVDSSDTLWLCADGKLYRRPHGQREFTSTGVSVFGPAELEEAPDQTIWIGGYTQPGVKPKQSAGQPPDVGLKHIDASGKRLPNPRTKDDVNALAVDSDGALWVSHLEGGLQRLRAGERNGTAAEEETDSPDLFGTSDGLTTTGFRHLLRDRDGNIWSTGGRGVDRFQHATMVGAVPSAINGIWSVCAAPQGDVWLSRFEGFFAVIRNHRLIRFKDQPGVAALLCEKNGKVLARAGDQGIAEVQNGRVKPLPLLPRRANYDGGYVLVCCVVLPDHRLLASAYGPAEDGLWAYANHAWKLFLPDSGFSKVRALWQDSHNELYLAQPGGKITVLEPSSYHVVSSEVGDISLIMGFSETSYGIFAFGANGVALRQNGAFRTLSFADPTFPMTVTGLVEDRAGNIWINGSRVIARISSSEISKAVSDRSHSIHVREFREGEYRGSDFPSTQRNSAQIDSQGRIWLPTSNGVIYIDPQYVDIPSRVPTLSIRSISADGRPPGANRSFPPETQTLNIHYFGLDLSNPKAVVYRYKLDGSDRTWQDAGDRTEAIYTHLRPAKYVFRVMASEGGAVWSQPVNSEAFTILPAFYQSWWFYALCVAAGVVLLWLGLTARVRYVSKAIRMRAEERATERIRIARELHDTLLQGVQGLSLSFHAAAGKVPDAHESKKALERALDIADRIILEGRDRLSRLRTDRLTSSEFEPSIRALADDLGSRFNVDFAMECAGGHKPLNPDILEEIYYIAREALTNAFRHSGASRIVFRFDYGKSDFSMECRDNGQGFDERELRQAESKGHWGFRGMCERAKKIGAKLSYETAPGDGVRVRLVLRASRAYLPTRSMQTLFRAYRGE